MLTITIQATIAPTNYVHVGGEKAVGNYSISIDGITEMASVPAAIDIVRDFIERVRKSVYEQEAIDHGR